MSMAIYEGIRKQLRKYPDRVVLLVGNTHFLAPIMRKDSTICRDGRYLLAIKPYAYSDDGLSPHLVDKLKDETDIGSVVCEMCEALAVAREEGYEGILIYRQYKEKPMRLDMVINVG